MGDYSDEQDIERFMRSDEGKAELEALAGMLKGRTIEGVEFVNERFGISTTLRFDDGSTFLLTFPRFDVDNLREEYSDAIRAEYLKDYPERAGERA